jgi:hypothetical protein
LERSRLSDAANRERQYVAAINVQRHGWIVADFDKHSAEGEDRT